MTDAGKVVQLEWEWLPNRFPGLELDEFVVMPNHAHGILVITENLRYSQSAKKLRPTLGDIIGDYKGAATYRIRHTIGIADFEWQKGFYDEIIRDTAMLRDIRHYITTNPEQWFADKLHPRNDTRLIKDTGLGTTRACKPVSSTARVLHRPCRYLCPSKIRQMPTNLL